MPVQQHLRTALSLLQSFVLDAELEARLKELQPLKLQTLRDVCVAAGADGKSSEQLPLNGLKIRCMSPVPPCRNHFRTNLSERLVAPSMVTSVHCFTVKRTSRFPTLCRRSLEAGSNGVHPAAQALSSAPMNGSMSASEQWATLASALDSKDETQAAAGIHWLSQLLICAAEASLQAGQGKLNSELLHYDSCRCLTHLNPSLEQVIHVQCLRTPP